MAHARLCGRDLQRKKDGKGRKRRGLGRRSFARSLTTVNQLTKEPCVQEKRDVCTLKANGHPRRKSNRDGLETVKDDGGESGEMGRSSRRSGKDKENVALMTRRDGAAVTILIL